MSATQSPLARLVLVMICLSVAGSIGAGIHYAAVDLPQQAAAMQNAPENNNCLAWEIVCLKDPLTQEGRADCCTGPCGDRWDYC
jgi:hypothetical protein